jgi:hypothetical protein
MAAAATVLQSFELLEAILLRANTYEILVATSVSTSWRAVVENSTFLHTYLLTLPIRKPPYHRTQQPWRHYKLNDSATDPWHFRVNTTNGSSLFVLRIPKEDVEVFLVAPAKRDNHLKVLDDAYDMYAVTTNYTPNLEFRRKNGEIVCRTKCTALRCTLVRYHGGYARQLKPKNGSSVFGDVLRRYLAIFYAEHYGPGIEMG